jgi:hypothetical protein
MSVWGRLRSTTRRVVDELWKGVVSALGLFVVGFLVNVAVNLRFGTDQLAAAGLIVFAVVTVPILIGNRRRLPFGFRRRTEEKVQNADKGETMMTGTWSYIRVDGATKRLFPQDPELVIARWWPDKVKVRADFLATDTTRMSVKMVMSDTKIQPEAISHDKAIQRWSLPSGRSFTKEFDTEAGVWFFVAARPKTNWFNPEVKVEVSEFRRISD